MRRLMPMVMFALLACRDPNSYQPFDPTMPDPPASPVLSYPVNGWVSDSYAYPQNVSFGWQAVPGAQFYELHIQTDSLFPGSRAGQRVYQTSLVYSLQTFGLYYWRVRAASHYWNDYTDWSSPFRFALPNPAK